MSTRGVCWSTTAPRREAACGCRFIRSSCATPAWPPWEGISPDMVDNALDRLRQEMRRGSCSLRTADALERFCREVLLSDRVQRCGTLREQTTVINAMLSQRYFTDRAPQYLWMPMETLTARLLERDFRTEAALTGQLLFRRELRAALLRALDGVSGCWTGNTSGTHFFWGLDRRAALFPAAARARARRR